MLFQILGTMPPESRLRSVNKKLELCTKAKLEELARAQPGTTTNKHTRQIRCRTKFRKLERLNSWLAEAIPTRRRSNDQGARSTTKAGAAGHGSPRMEVKATATKTYFRMHAQAIRSE